MAFSYANPSFGAHAAPKVAILTGIGVIALAIDLPELCILGGLLAYATTSSKSVIPNEWRMAVANHRITRTLETHSWILFVVAVALPSCMGTLSQLAFALLSAVAYVGLYDYGKHSRSKLAKADPRGPLNVEQTLEQAPGRRRSVEPSTSRSARWSSSMVPLKSVGPRGLGVDHGTMECPPSPPPRVATGFEAEVQEMVKSCTATRADDAVVRHLVKLARKCISPVIPEAEIRALASGNLAAVGAQGAKPEIDMIVSIDNVVLTERLKAYFLRGQTRIQKSLDTLHPDVLQKTATKCLSERLTFVRFWRSQFSGPEPMIVLLVPVELGICQYPLRLNFSVNTPYPLRLATIMSKECARARDLIHLVTRWARERCIANTSRGQPHCYAWALMTIYFVRRGMKDAEGNKSVGAMFKEFVEFYANWFDSRQGPVCISLSKKADEVAGDSLQRGLPFIEDPFDVSTQAAHCTTADGVERVKVELARARSMLERDTEANLAELVQRWSPSAATSPSGQEHQEQ